MIMNCFNQQFYYVYKYFIINIEQRGLYYILDLNAPSYIVFVVLEILTVINCIITLKLNIRLRINNCLNKNNINHDDTNTKKLSINNNSLTININLISIIKKNIDTYTS